MKYLSFFFLILFMSNVHASEKVFHDFTIESISGETINLSDYKSKVVLLVNTASKCGFTPQYSGLQKIYERYKNNQKSSYKKKIYLGTLGKSSSQTN